MKTPHRNSATAWPRLAVALSAANGVALAMLLLTGATAPERQQGTVANVVQTRHLELLDSRGRVRSSLEVEESGEVVLRMMDQAGTIRIKLGADRHGSGLVLLDEATTPGVHLIARQRGTPEQRTTGIVLQGANGRRRVLGPP